VVLAATEAAAYLGHYQLASPRNQYMFLDKILGVTSLEQRGNLLLLLPLLGKPDTLLATGPRTFRRPSEPISSVVLTRDAEGHRVLESRRQYSVKIGFWWWLLPVLLVLSALLVVTTGLAGLIWLGYALRQRLPPAQVLPRVLPLPAALAFAATLWAGNSVTVHWGSLGIVDTASVLLFAAPLLFTVCALVGLGLLLYRFRQFRSRLAAWYLLLAYGGFGFLVAVFGTYGWLGMRLWSV
jgi:hypothetical protein